MLLAEKPGTEAFRTSWRVREEARYNHWTAGPVRNQIQLAFRMHWEVFRPLLPGDSGRVLEVGCGRGSISSYFAQHGYRCHLLDASGEILRVAGRIFEANGHGAVRVQADAYRLPYADGSFDAVVSIGLMEHFEDVRGLLAEQVRVLAPGGRLLAYIVPEMPDNVQRRWRRLNRILRRWSRGGGKKAGSKPPVFRNDYGSAVYREILGEMRVSEVEAFGLYPLPMISHSPEFPFSLMHPAAERILTLAFRAVLRIRALSSRGRHPWICREGYGQAFLVTAVKPS